MRPAATRRPHARRSRTASTASRSRSSPLVDLVGTRRRWIVAMQATIGAACALVALALPAPQFFIATIAVFWMIAFASATHDIAADGFYMLAQSSHAQAAFVGVRSA